MGEARKNASWSSQLPVAEFGLEEGLRAFNKNSWVGWASNPTGITGGTTAWTIDSTNKRASRTLNFDASKLGQGATATVKIRVDNYDVSQLNATWSSSATYRVNDIVGYNGIWYRCVQNHSPSQTPNGISNLNYWVPAPIPSAWIAGQPYELGDMVFYNNRWRRCNNGHTSSTFVASNWDNIPNIYSSIVTGTYYNTYEVAYYSPLNTWAIRNRNGYGSDTAGWTATTGTSLISWQWDSAKNYSFGDVVYDSSTWYRYINGTPSNNKATSLTTYWENALTGSMYGWSNAGIKYNVGDVVYYSATNQWYRCIQAHTSSGLIAPSIPAYWSNSPLFSPTWDAGRNYGVSDTVFWNGIWYFAELSNNDKNPTTNGGYWTAAGSSTRAWNPTTAYALGSFVCYGGVWYKCASGNTGQPPNNSAYWTPSWANAAGITTGGPVIYAEATIVLPNNPSARTQLRAAINPASLFPNAAAASVDLVIGSGTGTVDSYDSSVSAYGGTNIGYSATLAAGSSISILGTTNVKGYLAWPTPAANISTNTTVKSATSPVGTNQDPTRISRSPFVPQFDIVPNGLAGGWSTTAKGRALATGTTVTIGTPGSTVASRYYYSGTLTMGGSSSNITTLNINGPVILYISNDLVMTGGPNGIININSTGSAEIHVGGGLKVDSGSDGIKNNTTNPRALSILCDSTSNTSQFYNEGANAFYGTIYAPKTGATGGFYFNLGDTNTTTMYGAVAASSVTYKNQANLHYDVALRYAAVEGIEQPYTVTDWRELPLTEQATIP